MHFYTYLQKSYIQLELLPHLIKDTYVTNISSWLPCEVSFSLSWIIFYSYQMVSVVLEQFRNHSANLLLSWA